MFNIRVNTFETNSSSVHTICITNNENYQQWINGQLYYNLDSKWNDFPEFVSYEEAKKYDPNFPYPDTPDSWENWSYQDSEKYYHEKIFVTAKEFFENWEFDFYDKEYITDNKEVIHVFGYYGHD